VIIIAAATAVVVFAVVAGCCGGAAYLVRDASKEVPAAHAAAYVFFADLQAGRTDDAYASTATGFKASPRPRNFGTWSTRSRSSKHTSRGRFSLAAS